MKEIKRRRKKRGLKSAEIACKSGGKDQKTVEKGTDLTWRNSGNKKMKKKCKKMVKIYKNRKKVA